MTDMFDKAQELEEMQRQHNLARHHSKTQQMINTTPYCDECGDEIPLKRRQMLPNVSTCVECQHIIEKIRR